MKELQAIFDRALTGYGSSYLSSAEVLVALGYAAAQKCVLQSMEAFRIDSDGDLPMIEYSILGLESASEWGATNKPETMITLVIQKMLGAQKEQNEVKYQVWFRKIEDI